MIKIIIVITAPDKQERKDVEDTYFCEMSDNKFYKSIEIGVTVLYYLIVAWEWQERREKWRTKK